MPDTKFLTDTSPPPLRDTKHVILLSSCLCGFWREIICYWESLICDEWLLYSCFQDQLDVESVSISLELVELLRCIYSWISSDLGFFLPNMFSYSCLNIFFWEPYNAYVEYLIISHRSFRLCSFIFSIFFCFSEFIISFVLIFNWSFLLPAQIWFWTCLENFSF